MVNEIISWIVKVFGDGIGQMMGVVIIAMIPVIELRGAIPVAFMMGLNWQTALTCAIIGNLFPIPFVLIFLDSIFKLMKKYNIFKGLVIKLEQRAISKSGKVSNFQFWGLAFFVAIPLPGTGAFTGALIASVMKMNRKNAFLSICIGVICAGILVTLASYGLIGNIIK